MMDPWLESHQSLRDHPKLFRLKARLKVNRAQVMGHLHLLWGWCITYALDGEVTRYTPEELAQAADWEGNAQEFVQALVESKFIDATEEGRFIHDWSDYCGALIDKRLERRAKSQLGGQRRQELLKSQNASLKTTPKIASKSSEKPNSSYAYIMGAARSPDLSARSPKTSARQPTYQTYPTVPTLPDPTRPSELPARDSLRSKGKTAALPPKTDANRLLYVIKTLQGYAFEDAEWDSVYLDQYKKDAEKLIKFFGGDWKKAGNFAVSLVQEFKTKELSWSMRTLVNRAPDWRKKNANGAS